MECFAKIIIGRNTIVLEITRVFDDFQEWVGAEVN